MIEFLNPVSKQILEYREELPSEVIGKTIAVHSEKGDLPNLANVKFAILGIKENRGNESDTGFVVSFDSYRKSFYALYPGNWIHNIIDIGDIEKGATVEDTRFAAKEVIAALLKKNIIPLILGGSQDLAFSQYRAYDYLQKMVNVVNIDSRFDIGDTELPISNYSYVGKMVIEEPHQLNNYSVLGYQSFLNSPKEIGLMEKLFFDAVRLGEVTQDLSSVEPYLRDADIVTLDATAIKSGDLGFTNNGGPNGFDSREICAVARYAGISNNSTSFGIYELADSADKKIQAMLVAQIIWYFVEGVNYRLDEGDFNDEYLFTSYQVPIEDEVLVFKKSNRTERWWINLPFISNVNNKLNRRTLLPCTYGEYVSACNQQFPERWLKARRKNEV